MRSLAISAAVGGGAGVVMAGEGDQLGGGEGADGEDDGDEGSLNSRKVTRQGIEPRTFWFAPRCSNH